MLRRRRAVLASAIVVAGLAAPPSQAVAGAAGYCDLTPPSRIALYQEVTSVPAVLSGDCVPTGIGYWRTPGENRFAVTVMDNGLEVVLLGTDHLDRYGLQPWIPDGALKDYGCEGEPDCDLRQNSPSSDIRLGGYASITGTRTGSTVTFTVGSGGWSPYSHRLTPRPRLAGEIQTRYADGTWHRVGHAFRTGADAKATVTVTVAARRSFRYAIYSTPSYFERASAPVTR